MLDVRLVDHADGGACVAERQRAFQCADGLIDREAALEIAPNREALMMALKGIGVM